MRMSTAEQRVLIVGQFPDIHTETVIKALNERGAQVYCLDRHGPDTVTCRLGDGNLHGTITTRTGSSDLSRITAGWWRVKPTTPVEFSGGTGDDGERFRWAEWRQVLTSLQAATPRAFWINGLEEHRQAGSKLRQLIMAQSVGLEIPDTAITNDNQAVLGLYQRHERVIYKTLSSYLIPPYDIIYTNETTIEQVANSADSIRLAPGIFQQYVDKAYELRVTVVGTRIFACRIDSQTDDTTRTDWRRDQFRDMYSVFSLPNETANRLLALHQRLGLHYAAYDFIVDRSGDLVFLECNPGGQWLFIENATGLPIADAIASDLSETARITAEAGTC